MIAINFLLGVVLLSAGFPIANGMPADLSLNHLAEVVPIATILCILPFSVAHMATRNIVEKPLMRSLIAWTLTGAGGAAILLLVFTLLASRQVVEASDWLLCLYLGAFGAFVGIVLYFFNDAVLRIRAGSKAKRNGA